MTSDTHPAVRTWLDLAAENRGSARFHLSFAAFRLILRGYAPSRDELTGLTSIDRTESLELIQAIVDEGRLRLDDSEDRVVGAGGLSLAESCHSLTIGSQRFGVWCALDAVGIPAGLDVDATIESECADTGEPVIIEIKAGVVVTHTPADLFISLVPASVAASVFDTL